MLSLVLFTWKAAAKDIWGDVFLGVAVVCLVAQVARLIPWPSADRWAMSVMGVLVGGGLTVNEVVPHRGLDLFREDLKGAYLVRANLRDAKLREAKLQGANLSWAKLQEADLREANLRNATLRNADLLGAKYIEADFEDGDLQGATLRGGNFYKVNLKGALLMSADLRDAEFLVCEQLTEAKFWVFALRDQALSCDAPIQAVKTFANAKKIARDQIYVDQAVTFYCGCKYQASGRSGGLIDSKSCNFQPRRNPVRASPAPAKPGR